MRRLYGLSGQSMDAFKHEFKTHIFFMLGSSFPQLSNSFVILFIPLRTNITLNISMIATIKALIELTEAAGMITHPDVFSVSSSARP